MSLAVSANAAFDDVKDIDETYAESAAVLNGLGVFKGYEEKDGTFSFQPKNAITVPRWLRSSIASTPVT